MSHNSVFNQNALLLDNQALTTDVHSALMTAQSTEDSLITETPGIIASVSGALPNVCLARVDRPLTVRRNVVSMMSKEDHALDYKDTIKISSRYNIICKSHQPAIHSFIIH